MGKYKVWIKPSAAKELAGLPTKKDRRRIVAKIRQLAEDPRPPGCTKLSGRDRYRIRQGSFRIVYAIEDDRLIVYVVAVGHRKDIYRRSL